MPSDFHNELVRLNAAWVQLGAVALPDGNADLDHLDFSGFMAPPCTCLAACSQRKETARPT
jgi:hypothetical protein